MTPAALNASRRSRHLLQRPQCASPPSCGFMQDSVSPRSTLRSSPSVITSDLSIVDERRFDRQRVIEADRQRPRERAEEFGRGVGKRIAGERADRDPRDLALRGDHRGLREQHDVAAVDVDLFVGRVIGRRLAADGPVRGGIDVAHVELERQRRQDVLRERLGGRELRQAGAFRGFPGKADADVERQDASGPREVRDQHGAVESGGAEYGDSRSRVKL